MIWQCNGKFKSNKICQTPHFYEDTLKQVFTDAFNSLIENKDEILQGYHDIIDTLTDTSALDQVDYQQRYDALVKRYETAKSRLAEIDDMRLERVAKCENISIFIKTLEQNETLLTEFDEELWNATVDMVTVHSEHEITFTFKDGMELPWHL